MSAYLALSSLRSARSFFSSGLQKVLMLCMEEPSFWLVSSSSFFRLARSRWRSVFVAWSSLQQERKNNLLNLMIQTPRLFLCTAKKIRIMNSQKSNARPCYLFPYSYICDRFIYSQDRSHLFCCSQIGRPIVEYINCSHADMWIYVEIGTEALQFLFWEHFF